MPRHSLYVLQRDLLRLGARVDPLLDVQGRQSERRAALHFHGKALLQHVTAALEEMASGEVGTGIRGTVLLILSSKRQRDQELSFET